MSVITDNNFKSRPPTVKLFIYHVNRKYLFSEMCQTVSCQLSASRTQLNCGVQVEDSQGKVGVLDVVARFRVRNMSGYVTVYYSFADTADTAEQVGCDWSPGQPVLTPDWSSRTPWWSWSAPTPTPGSRRADSSSPSTEEDLAGDPN